MIVVEAAVCADVQLCNTEGSSLDFFRPSTLEKVILTLYIHLLVMFRVTGMWRFSGLYRDTWTDTVVSVGECAATVGLLVR